jgi:hypothetical protein
MDDTNAHDAREPHADTDSALQPHGDAGESITDLADDLDLTAEQHVAESLQSALKQLRDNAEELSAVPMDERRVEAAERVAEDAAAIDEQIGSIARSEDA